MSVLVTFNGTTYSLPTVSETGWGTQVTNMLSDLGANAVTSTDSRTMSGKVFQAQPGTVGAPGYSFGQDPDTGIFQPAIGQLAIATNGVQRVIVDAAGNLSLATGSITTPTITSPTITGGTATSLTLTNPTLANPTLTGNGITYSQNPTHSIGYGWNGTQLLSYVDGAFTGAVNLSGQPNNATSYSLTTSNGFWSSDSSITTLCMADNWKWQFNRSTGTNSWVDYTNSPLFSVDAPGSIYAKAAVNAGAGISNTQGGITQSMFTSGGDGYLNVGNSWRWRWEGSSGNLYWQNSAGTQLEGMSGAAHWFCGDPYFSISASGGQRIFAFANTWYWSWNTANGDLGWNGPGGGIGFFLRVSDGLSYSVRGPGGGNGPYSNISDISVKADILEADHGLEHVCALTPKTFRRTTTADADEKRVELGFVAQDVQAVLPEAVRDIGQDGESLLAMTLDPIVAALVNAVKTLTARIQVLEARTT